MRANEIKINAKQFMSYSNWPWVISFHLAHKQCNGIIKGWSHWPRSESNEKFFVSNILFGSSWCLVMAGIQFVLIKRNKDWTSRTAAKPHSLTSDVISSSFYQSERHMCITTSSVSICYSGYYMAAWFEKIFR